MVVWRSPYYPCSCPLSDWRLVASLTRWRLFDLTSLYVRSLKFWRALTAECISSFFYVLLSSGITRTSTLSSSSSSSDPLHLLHIQVIFTLCERREPREGKMKFLPAGLKPQLKACCQGKLFSLIPLSCSTQGIKKTKYFRLRLTFELISQWP